MVLESQISLLGLFVIAMEIDHIHRKSNRLGNGKLPSRYHIKSQTLPLEDGCQGPVEKGLAGIKNHGIGIALAKLVPELLAPATQSNFIIYIQRRAILSGQLHGITTADYQVPLLAHPGIYGKQR